MQETTPFINNPQPWTQAPAPLDVSQQVSNNVAPSPLLKPIDLKQKGNMKKSNFVLILFLIAILGGVGTGTGLYKLSAKSGGKIGLGGNASPISQIAGTNIKNGDVFGSSDESTFKDSAEGYLEIGGINGEGTHKLLRAGGVSQTVYLTSSVTDLDKFQGMEVKLWGETFKAQNAGWLMDVGRVQITNTKGELPEGHTAASPVSEGEDE